MAADHATSTGRHRSSAGWLDAHFELARPEYEEGLRWVGVRPGWRVLDAGCGGGGFLPLLCGQVGPAGLVTALDLAPENITRVEDRARVESGLTNLQARVGSILDLPLPDDGFDCVWTANVFQYLTDAEIARALAEFQRVLKPGGVVALKDYDASLLGLHPMDSTMFARWSLARRADSAARGIAGAFCGLTLTLPTRLRCAGLLDVRRRTWLVERTAPLAPLRAGWAALMGRGCGIARPAGRGHRGLAGIMRAAE
jgi:arsenite methyltransferase